MSREGPEVCHTKCISNDVSVDIPPPKQRYKHDYWTSQINQSFAAGAVFKLTLWKDNIAAEAKPFELGLATLPRFFLVTSQSGVKSMTLTAEGAVERLGRAPNGAPNMTLDCPHATWTCRYTTGYTVTLRGPISASMSMQADGVLRFDSVTFEAKHHEKHIIVDAIGRGTPKGATPATLHSSPSNSNTTKTDDSLDTKTGLTPDDRTAVSDPNLPPDPVNGFGVPQATMRCLEVRVC
ncbi:hypothetical protein AURDEDRAFT_53428 [Auricularia subglabra TFB-10046 SS5]|nr:hypothetical protein AURDEDRAFT_53428 [Auricularia subglabra TFB-10046 SS5]